MATGLALVSWGILVTVFGMEVWAAALWTLGVLLAPLLLIILGVLVVAVISAFDKDYH